MATCGAPKTCVESVYIVDLDCYNVMFGTIGNAKTSALTVALASFLTLITF